MAAGAGLADRVLFSGMVGREELISLYGRADAVVFPVRWNEPWGLVPLEAMARGRPVVATGRGGSGEYLVDGRTVCSSTPIPRRPSRTASRPLPAPRSCAPASCRRGCGSLTSTPRPTSRRRSAARRTRGQIAARDGCEESPYEQLPEPSRSARRLRLPATALGRARCLRRGPDGRAGEARDRVSYFFSGRYFRWLSEPRLKRWSYRGVEMFEVLGSPLYDHGRQPDLELAEPQVEALFEAALSELSPDVIHFQELVGLPSSVLELARRHRVPPFLTLQDYFPLCPDFKLVDSRGELCLRRDVGEECRLTLQQSDRDPKLCTRPASASRSIVSCGRYPSRGRLGHGSSKHSASLRWPRRAVSGERPWPPRAHSRDAAK